MSNECVVNCPLCMEEMDPTDKHLKPCKCGYEICVWCWNNIITMAEKNETEGRCPACRAPYDKEKILRNTISSERLVKQDSLKQKLQKNKSKQSELPKDLSGVRIIRRNIVYVSGLPATFADEKTLKKKEFFGQYGKILKISLLPPVEAFLNSRVVYITFSKEEEALRCIETVDGFILGGGPLKACFGTTGYCHAWLKNGRCDRPDCLYVHDVCAQEDICTKDDVASTCTSKLQKSSGSTSNSLVSRSGSMLPPPMDTSCSSSSSTGGKVLPESLAHEGDARKSSALPPTASWASAPTSSRLSYASVTVSQGPLDHSHMPSNLIIKATDSRAQIPASSQNVNQSDDGTFKSSHSMMVTNGPVNESALFQRHTVTEFEEHTGLRNFWASDLANIGIKSAACRSSCENYDNDTVQKIRSNQQLSVASANDFIRSSIMDKTRVNSSYYFCSPVNRSYQGSDCVDAIGVGLSSDEFFGTINIQDATIPNLQARSHGSLLNVASATRVHAPCQNKLSGCLDEVLTESLNKVKSSTVDVDNNYCTTTSSTANPLILDGSAVGSSTCQDVGFNSFLYSQGKLLNNSSCANEDFEYLYRRPPLLEKGISNLNFGDSPEAAWKEYDIMSDILSLDLAHDDHLIGSSLARHFADNGRSNYPAICDSKTCFNGNNSLYAFQRMDNFDHAKTKSCFTESNISNVKYCGQLDDVKKFATHIYACRVDNFLPVSHFNEHNSDNSQHSLFSTDIASESKTLFICESASNSKLKGSQIKPTPGFHPEVADNPDPLFLSSPIYGSGFNEYNSLSGSWEINRNSSFNCHKINNYVTTEFSCGNLFHSGQLISPKSGPSTVDFTRGEHMSSRLRNFVENPVGLANESTSSMMNNLYWQTGGNDYDISGTSYTTGSFTASVSEVRESGFPDIINSLIPGSKYGSLRWSV